MAPAALAAAILLTSATQLRIPGTPVGPGEVLLAGVLGLVAMGTLSRRRFRVAGVTVPWLLFWTAAFAALLLGWVVGLVTGESTTAGGRDAIAYLLCAVMVAVLVTQGRGQGLIVETVAWLVVEAAVVLGALLGIGLLGSGRLGPTLLWYHDVRFRAWAVNPNQLALFLAPLPWLAGALRPAAAAGRWLMGTAAAVLVLVGLATRSDALLVAWALAALGIGLWWFLTLAARPTKSLLEAALGRLVLPLGLLMIGLVGGPPAVGWIEDRVFTAYAEGGQGSDRFARWGFGLEALAASPLVGFGPGSFSGAAAAFSGQEAHNTPIDWATSTGLVGLIAFGAVCAWSAARCVRARSRLALATIVTVLIFMGLHYVLRQPVAWFCLIGAVAVAERGRLRLVPLASTGEIES